MSFCAICASVRSIIDMLTCGELGQLAVVGLLEVGELAFELRHVRADALGFLGVELGGIRGAALALTTMFGEERRHQPLRALLRLLRHAVVVRHREGIHHFALAAGARIEDGRGHDLHVDVAAQALEHRGLVIREIRVQVVLLVELAQVAIGEHDALEVLHVLVGVVGLAVVLGHAAQRLCAPDGLVDLHQARRGVDVGQGERQQDREHRDRDGDAEQQRLAARDGVYVIGKFW